MAKNVAYGQCLDLYNEALCETIAAKMLTSHNQVFPYSYFCMVELHALGSKKISLIFITAINQIVWDGNQTIIGYMIDCHDYLTS